MNLTASKTLCGSCAGTGAELAVDPRSLTLYLASLQFFCDKTEDFFLLFFFFILRSQSFRTILGEVSQSQKQNSISLVTFIFIHFFQSGPTYFIFTKSALSFTTPSFPKVIRLLSQK